MIVTVSIVSLTMATVGSYLVTGGLAYRANLAISAGLFDEATAKFAARA